jgi:hypothetical protein
VNDKGYLFSCEKRFDKNRDYLWAIPLSEINVNPNLEQNPGYN